MKDLLMLMLTCMLGKQNRNTLHARPNPITDSKMIQVIVNCSKNDKNIKDLEKIGEIKYSLPMINSYVLEIPKNNMTKLRDLNGVEKVEQDAEITAQMNIATDTINATWNDTESKNGEGITVAILDTGIYPHNDLVQNKNRLIAFKDFVNNNVGAYDDNGHGTHVAGIVGGDGFESDGKYIGVAPKCNIIGLKVLDKKGTGNISDVLAGIQWVLDYKDKYNIRIINLSVGMEDVEGEDAALVKGVNVAWDNNIIVVCAAGNNGPGASSITTPGVSRKVITVGSSDDAETVTIQGDTISNYSGRGPTKNCIKKPDVVAPGSNIISCNSDLQYTPKDNTYPTKKVGYIKKSGTSMASPIISGAITKLLSDYPDITNRDIKICMRYSTNDLGFDQHLQGWGLIDVKKLYDNLGEVREAIVNLDKS